ncbi:MAG: hypothetical protein A2275_07415 [Bacteroidetes bacterium RIFOXYA12_FULL_35_11]|nr:MAG: hypothetical protein A2X01_06505 [Bacteroidetes bacterium GWF2_35_48]OFY73076.1 MAG: hypothetical protein A2275_07415 [Bacteroidetes bacterium RIFOXYA12_FULL_35_11]OFY94622.1 MAG: hypothetical protein A2491_08905 [Bacteroidetes bacterium RIFOXYC12_FULL_35_7]OFY97436.1 MAG: hypothetical protein A2309_04080 [Bacteroidetes bacterium RIFOXYB2_FULL_35_7]
MLLQSSDFNSSFSVRCTNISFHSANFFSLFINALRSITVFICQLYKFKPSIVIFHCSGDISAFRELILSCIAKLFFKKTICHYHGEYVSFPFNPHKYERNNSIWWEKIFFNIFFHFSNKVFVLTDKILDDFCIHLNKKTFKKLSVLNNFINIGSFKEKIVNTKYIKILFVGRLEKLKGYYDFEKIIGSINKKYNNVHFLICGAKGADVNYHILNKKNVFYQGEIFGEKKYQIFAEADILVLPSYSEVFPVVLLEAMAQGLPVVSTNVGAIPEIIKDGENGFLCEPGDVNALLKNVVSLIENAGLRSLMGKNNKEKALKKYAVQRAVNQYREACEILLSKKNQ